MNPFSAILPPGSPLARVSAQRQSRVRVAVFIVLAIATSALLGLLIQGCIHANHTTTVAGTAATDSLVSGVTTPAAAAAHLPVTVSTSQRHAPLVAAPAAVPKTAPLLAIQGARVKNYSVVKGDTYSKIAKVNGVSINALTKANLGIDPTKLRIRQMLHIPVVGQKQALPPPNTPRASVNNKH